MSPPKTHWTGHGDGHSWGDAANWAQGEPASGIDAVFAGMQSWSVRLGTRATPLVAGALIVQGEALTLTHGALSLEPQPAMSGNTFDMVLTQGAQLTVDAGVVVSGLNVAEIGAGGTGGTLTVLGTVREEYGIVSNGMLDISGPSGHWLGGFSGVDIGGGSQLMVQNGGTLDAGHGTFTKPASALNIGDNAGDASAVVTGAGSVVRESGVVLGQGYGSGTLLISDGAAVTDRYASLGALADGNVTVTDPGSTWVNFNGITIGGQVPVASGVTITNGGSVHAGRYGIGLYGTLSLDASARLTSPSILSGGGVIIALPGGGGTVTLGEKIDLTYNSSAPYTTETTYLEATAGTTLVMSGKISGDTTKIVDASTGHVVLSHADNVFGSAQIYAATLEIAAEGAAGAGPVSFVGGAHAANLTLDAGFNLSNQIAGFGQADTIDLRGLSFGQDITKTWSPGGSGGTLTLSNGAEQTILHFSGNLTADSFTLAADAFGGTNLLHS